MVIASEDPTDKAAGRGPGILRDEGIDVVMLNGEISTTARLLNQPFRKHARTGRPLVIFKSAMTLDGKVVTRTGDSQWISGKLSRARAHRWRAESDAVQCESERRSWMIRGSRPGRGRCPSAAARIFDSRPAYRWIQSWCAG